ncbi:putative membrane protein [Klebsiella phage UPM 2146]|uniref:Putative membrane protein n=1 Tax=Klebsiella phage UPM 2146 TaxID=2847816 RepID=A0A5Q2F2K1_9CAUD|nr:membrane-flanked domain [Klebsiella phage UPM 2146]QGF20592.1 putative membrane protein [Klebsiella phage UPM 2146]
MRYVDRMLGQNEHVIGFTRPTWWSGFWVYFWVVVFLVPTFGISLFFLIPTIIRNLTTEFAVTNKRVIFKTGFIRRDADELRLGKVETVKVDQSITGRVLRFSTISVIGTGGTRLVAKGCAKGNDFRRVIYDQLDN